MNPINKVMFDDRTGLVLRRGGISIGVSSDYMVENDYAESCDTCWYQGVSSSGTGRFDKLVAYGLKSPGGSLFFESEVVQISNASGFLSLTGRSVYIVEFWFKDQTAGTQDYTIMDARNGDGKGMLFATSDGSIIVSLGSTLGGWDLTSDFKLGNILADTWHHIGITKYGNIYYGLSDGSVGSIVNTSKEVDIGAIIYLGGNGDYTSLANCSITNLRFMYGYGKYNISGGYNVPICPLSAVGYSGASIESPLLLNVFQESRKLTNSGDRSISVRDATGTTQFNTDSPFLSNTTTPLPRIFTKTYNNTSSDYLDLINTMNIQDGLPTYSAYQPAVEWLMGNSGSYWIQNFNYENIPTSGLTNLYDSGYFMSYPKTGSTWYDLMGQSNDFLFSGTTLNSGFAGNTSITLDGTNFVYYDQGINVNSAFSFIAVFSTTTGTTYDNTQTIPEFAGNNGFSIRSEIGTKKTRYNISDSGGTLTQIGEVEPSDLRSNNMFGFTSNGSNVHKGFLNGTKIFTNNFTITRSADTILDAKINSGQTLNYLLMMLYDRELSESEMSRIYNQYKSRMAIP